MESRAHGDAPLILTFRSFSRKYVSTVQFRKKFSVHQDTVKSNDKIMINYGTNGKNLISNKKYKIRNTKWASPDSQWFGLFIFSSFLHTHTERHFFVIWSPLFRILPIWTQVECYFCILIYFLYYYWVGYLAATFILIRILNTLTFLFQPSHFSQPNF